MTGKPVVGDMVTRAILAGRDLTVFANLNVFQEHHLRILVTMPRTPLYIIKMVAREPETHPERAIDYCSSAAMARVLIGIGGDVRCFALYGQDSFLVYNTPLHDFRKGADSFRRKKAVYEVICERVLFGGKVLPLHVASWFVAHGNSLHSEYMRKRGSDHMLACYDVYEKQAFECTEEVIVPVSYDFMIAYHRYTKYLPLIMFIWATDKKKRAVEQAVEGMVDMGYTCDQIDLFVKGRVMREFAAQKRASSKKDRAKKRKFSRAMKSKEVRELYGVFQKMFALGCCKEYIMSFL